MPDRLDSDDPIPTRPDPLSDEQWRVLYRMVMARHQYETKARSDYRRRRDAAPSLPCRCGR